LNSPVLQRSIDLLFAVHPRTKARVAAVQAPGYYIPLLSAANFSATAMIFLHAQCSKKSLSGIKLLVLFFFFSRLFSATFTGSTFLGFFAFLGSLETALREEARGSRMQISEWT
jgi:hypothetical protein